MESQCQSAMCQADLKTQDDAHVMKKLVLYDGTNRQH